jgi:hypothetical protein
MSFTTYIRVYIYIYSKINHALCIAAKYSLFGLIHACISESSCCSLYLNPFNSSYVVEPALMSDDTHLMSSIYFYFCFPSTKFSTICRVVFSYIISRGFQSKSPSFIFSFLVFRDGVANFCSFSERNSECVTYKVGKKTEWKGLREI